LWLPFDARSAVLNALITCFLFCGSSDTPIPPNCCEGLITIFLYSLKNLNASSLLFSVTCLGTGMLKEESILFVRFFLFAIVVLGVFVSGVAVLIIYQCLFSF